ncbi:MAG: hypothetical protein M3Z54_00865, partial [Gemmatimonadota bacterium]|nr:hypothetical protein [Gemmatimonadota bacterium]
MQRRSLLRWTAALGALATASIQAAQPPGRVERLAGRLFDRRELWVEFPPALTAELAAMGWVEGRNLSVQWRDADGDPALLRSHVEAIVASAPDAIVTRGSPATQALQRATRSIPILPAWAIRSAPDSRKPTSHPAAVSPACLGRSSRPPSN